MKKVDCHSNCFRLCLYENCNERNKTSGRYSSALSHTRTRIASRRRTNTAWSSRLSATPARGLHLVVMTTRKSRGLLSATPARGLHPLPDKQPSPAGCSQPHPHADCIGNVGTDDIIPARSQPHPHADCIGTMQQRWLCIRTLCIQFKPYRVYPAEQKRSNAVLISILGCRVTLCHVHYDAYSMFNWGSHWYIRG